MNKIINFFVSLYALVVSAFAPRPAGFYTFSDPKACGNVDADLYANTITAVPPAKVSAAQLGGRIRIFRASYTQGAVDGTIGDIVRFGKLPMGATPLPFGYAFFGTGNTNETLKFGLTGNDACFAAATAAATAGSVALNAFAASGAVLTPLTADTEVLGTNGTAAIKAAQKITVWIPYVMND